MKKRYFLTITGLIVFSLCSCQAVRKLSRPEKTWTVVHPYAAFRVYKISKRCDEIYKLAIENAEMDTFTNGGTLDAYRHMLYMAAFSQKVKPNKIRKLGIAHEKGNYLQFKNSKIEDGEIPDSLSSVMDLWNNQIGIELGNKYKQQSLTELNQHVLTEIKFGKVYVLKRNNMGEYMTCNGQVIVLSDYNHKWNIPKCLILLNSEKTNL